ncbi:uncharacterized protein LOC107368455 isoform X2 [Tetranychus urticae]|uniref:uncharacterized protein LOC107368455 isoform X2 n=1 Tax=Tetranychus urticae TaxID=32264 RepID=UPI00077BA925|nr:uncharacterized protein LOC107368455 isoform X2 [Tetranychus urticae]
MFKMSLVISYCFYILMLIAQFWIVKTTDLVDCDAIAEESDRCGLKLAFIGDRDFLIPGNDSQMEVHCRTMYDNYSCLRHYVRNCMKTVSKSLFVSFLYDVKRDLKQRCSTSGREAFLNHIACLRNASAENMESIHQCKDNYVIQLEWIMDNVRSEDQIIAGCCAYAQTQDCLKQKTAKICAPAEETMDYLNKMVHSTTTQAINYACTKYRNVSQCRQDLDEVTWRRLYESGIGNNKPDHHYKSSVMVTMALLSSAKQPN